MLCLCSHRKIDIVLRVPQLRQGPAYPGQNPKERNCKPKRAVSHGMFRSEDHGVCSRARLLHAVLARAALATPASCCPRTRVDAVQRQACSLPPLLLPVLPIHPLPALSLLSPFHLPKLLCKTAARSAHWPALTVQIMDSKKKKKELRMIAFCEFHGRRC